MIRRLASLGLVCLVQLLIIELYKYFSFENLSICALAMVIASVDNDLEKSWFKSGELSKRRKVQIMNNGID